MLLQVVAICTLFAHDLVILSNCCLSSASFGFLRVEDSWYWISPYPSFVFLIYLPKVFLWLKQPPDSRPSKYHSEIFWTSYIYA